MDGNTAGGHLLEMTCCLNKLLSPVNIKRALWAHSAHNASTPNGDIGIFMCQKYCGAYALISTAGWVCSVYARNDGYTQLFQFSMAEKGGAISSPVGINFLLLGQFYSAAVYDPHKGHMKPFGHVSNPELIICLSRDPGTGYDLVVESDDYCPFAIYFGESVYYPCRPLYICLGIVKGMEGAPGAGVDEVFKPLPDRHLASFLDDFSRYACIFYSIYGLSHLLFHFFDLCHIFLCTFLLAV